jgi:protein-tyrosine phosphatase
MYSVLFVCMGNICRSPMAEGVFRHLLRATNLERRVVADSAGTHAYHIGEAPDLRAQRAAAARGYDISGLRARKIVAQDIEHFDLILAMDRQCLDSIRLICPPEYIERLGLFMDYARGFGEDEVPDPYYGSGEGFERVLDMVEDASSGLVAVVRERVFRF